MPTDAKYVVLKDGEELEPDTYFVIRDRDVLGAAGLWAYVYNLQTVLELVERGLTTIPPEEVAHLYDLREYTSELAARWQESARKLPT